MIAMHHLNAVFISLYKYTWTNGYKDYIDNRPYKYNICGIKCALTQRDVHRSTFFFVSFKYVNKFMIYLKKILDTTILRKKVP